MVFVILKGLVLGLGQKLTYISKGKIIELSLIFILIILLVLIGFFFDRFIAFWALSINFSYF